MQTVLFLVSLINNLFKHAEFILLFKTTICSGILLNFLHTKDLIVLHFTFTNLPIIIPLADLFFRLT